MGIPGYLDGGGGSLATLYRGGQSQECPGKVWLRGNPGILGQGVSDTLHAYTVHAYCACVFLWWTIPGVSWDGLVTWESRDTWTGGSLATLSDMCIGSLLRTWEL